MGLLDGKAAIVAGIGPGLGRSIAHTLAREGASVALAARRPEHLDAVAAELEAIGHRTVTVPTDVTIASDADRLIAAAYEAFGRVDVVVYNAFLYGPTTPATETDLDAWRDTFEVNVVGALNVVRAAVPHLAASDDGSVVLVNTQAARRSLPRRGPYAASKAALLSVARTLAGELGADGVRVNSVVPGPIWSPPLEAALAQRAERVGTTVEEEYARLAADAPLGRIATADEVADAVLFFASPLAHAVTGQSLDVNAGNWFH
ncbi:MAG TPA: SDR family oxidoreductase [Acidimicrobiia bacterium]|nr:SDR family oxidoreductase [Acidimicrobiia bacterium]